MKTLKQDPGTNDISMSSDHGLAVVDGIESYANIIADKIRTVRGELQLDIESGIPYFQTVFKSQRNIGAWQQYVRKTVNDLPFVNGITDFTARFDEETKELRYEMSVDTDMGAVTINQ